MVGFDAAGASTAVRYVPVWLFLCLFVFSLYFVKFYALRM